MEIKPIEWLDFKIGRQQISYGDARILGPGQWGNTGRYAWDAIVAIINNQYIKTHLWVGRYLIRDPNKWPNPSTHYPTSYVIYSTIKRLIRHKLPILPKILVSPIKNPQVCYNKAILKEYLSPKR